MTPDEHAARAAELLRHLDAIDLEDHPELLVQAAHVHAILATRQAAPIPDDEPSEEILRDAIERLRSEKSTGLRKIAHMVADITDGERRERWIRRVADAFGRDVRSVRREVSQWVEPADSPDA